MTGALNSVSDFQLLQASRDIYSCAKIEYTDSFSFSSNCK